MKSVDLKQTMSVVEMINSISECKSMEQLMPLMNESYNMGLEKLFSAKKKVLELDTCLF